MARYSSNFLHILPVSVYSTGVVGLVCTALGIMCAGGFITKVRPRARSLAAFNILAGVIAMFGVLSYTFLGCVQGDEYNLRISKAK